MKDYIKPTFTLAGLFPVALAAEGCASTREDLDLISAILGGVDVKDPNAFAITENCKVQYDIEQYCKFTAVEAGSAKILGS